MDATSVRVRSCVRFRPMLVSEAEAGVAVTRAVDIYSRGELSMEGRRHKLDRILCAAALRARRACTTIHARCVFLLLLLRLERWLPPDAVTDPARGAAATRTMARRMCFLQLESPLLTVR